ncbi:chain length determinant protein EpsF [Methylobacillus flagellatus]|uniref:Lipopolysaccharide biosynthesis n=1 Tax=Methylobacillus flagellatus (strain ATCC 51484 / DSM 6875 / VKM B-1610 / KT) TaxID=265072 RepID=Q1GZP5_METFK|nr:chain length determinant protein EpsF [Methylobacillus flagellatus]ABE50292.1 lipopolysaccharide biosynthesis [Methylobacillus flagellatus KT]
MSFIRFISIIKARYKIIIFTLFITVLTTAIVTILLPKNYKATASVLVNYKGADPVTGVMLPAQLMPGYMATQVDIISSKNVAKKVIDKLGLADVPAVKEDFYQATSGKGEIKEWLADLLLKKLQVKPSRESSIIDISFFGVNPQFAATIANEFAESYMQTSIQLKVEPSQKAALYFVEQLKELREDLAQAQSKLSEYQQEKGIVSVDERLDVERARLNELSSQLVIAQAQVMEARSREKNSSGKEAYESPDVAANPIIQNLKTEIARAESRFADVSQKFERNHPFYLGAKAEIENLKSELDRQIKSVSSNVASNSRILQQREAEIRLALNNQKEKVLQLNRDRDILSVLTREVENAQKAYDMAMQRYTQTNIEGQSNQSDISLLNPAVAPLTPTSPNLLLNIILSILLGMFLGIGFGVLAEFVDRRVRTADDLIEVLQAPLLGTISKEKRKLRFFKNTSNLITLGKAEL